MNFLQLVQAAFKHGSEELAQHIVHFCENLDAGKDAITCKIYRAVAEQGVRLTEIIHIIILIAILVL